MIVSCLGFGLAGLYLGYFHESTVCDSSGCHLHAAGTIEPTTALVSGVFFLIGVYLLVRALRRRKVGGSASIGTRLKVSADEQGLGWPVKLGLITQNHPSLHPLRLANSTSRCFHCSTASRLAQMISTPRYETLRSHVRHEGLFFNAGRTSSTRNRCGERGASTLQWVPPTPETWQLRCNWNRLLRIVGVDLGGSEYPIAPRWIAPDIGQPSVGRF